MTQETIDRLHELEERRKGLEVRIELFNKMFATNRDDLVVEIKAMGWHSGIGLMRFEHMPKEVMDALVVVHDRTARELDEVNKLIEEL